MTERIDRFLAKLERMDVEDLAYLALKPIPLAERDELLIAADSAAIAGGRLDELDEAADRASAAIIQALSRRAYDPTWLGINWGRTTGRVEDRVELIRAVEDGAVAAVIADLDPETAAALAEPFELLSSMAGAAPARNPESGTRRNTVRAIWALAAVALLVTIGVATTDLVIEVIGTTCPPEMLC